MRAVSKDPNIPAISVVPNFVKHNPGIAGANPTVGEVQAELARRIAKARPDLLKFPSTTPPR